ncbi:hypothetical protein NDU88_007338 [Pleurodeles waltl]|uniref:Uncharacterized protein n=1 Tax=Pleurodeles waltl TaxID=8319 RepID=A0AAV7RSR1_PLEWA|nr:hypothetical protein NDU88_007338 [Pleurodeles waltl]
MGEDLPDGAPQLGEENLRQGATSALGSKAQSFHLSLTGDRTQLLHVPIEQWGNLDMRYRDQPKRRGDLIAR